MAFSLLGDDDFGLHVGMGGAVIAVGAGFFEGEGVRFATAE